MGSKIVTEQLQASMQAAKRLMQSGGFGPTAAEIAKEAHGGLWPVGKQDIEWTTKHLPVIRAMLEKDEDLTVCLVNKEYYKARRRVPTTPELAKRMLPMPGSFKAIGLHLVTSEDDPIFLAERQKKGDVGIGAIKKMSNDVDKAIKQNLISQKNGRNFVKAIKDRV